MRLLLIFALLTVFLQSCTDCINSNAPRYEVNRDISSFTVLQSNTLKLYIDLYQGKEQDLIVKGTENALINLQTSVTSDILTIENTACKESPTKLFSDVYIDEALQTIILENNEQLNAQTDISLNDLSFILSNTASATIEKLNVSSLTATAHDNASLQLGSGKSARVSNLTFNNNATCNAAGFITDTLYCTISDSSIVTIGVSQYIKANIQGDAKLYYRGNPTIVSESGSSSIIKID
ncbi:MAG: DUF2807 domain-containing protein [Bacteroidales bacterium]|nr:DUF2807 domain-containing protein [Bacteroidales bacterium]